MSKSERWARPIVLLHWVMAIIVVALYVLGDYMVDLDYYDPWYQSAPFWHKSFGLLLAMLLILRVISRLAYAAPKEPAISGVIRYSAIFVHLALYVLLIGVMASGYLISTADGRGIAFFSWFEVASFGELFENQEDVAGVWHERMGLGLLVLAGLHALAAIKHHCVDRDKVLRRMISWK